MNKIFDTIDQNPILSICILAVIVGMVWLFYEIDNAPISEDDNF